MFLDSENADLAGDFILYATNEGGIPWTVYPLQTSRVTIKPVTTMVKRYIYRIGEIEEVYEQEDVIHIQQPDPGSDTYGLATLRAAGRAVDTGNAIHEAQKTSMDQVVRPSGLLTGDMGKEVYEALKADIAANKAGAKNVGKVLIARSNLKFQPFMLTPAEVDYIQSLRLSNDEIAAAMEVDPVLLGTKDAKYANKREARVFLEETCVIPRLIDSRDTWNLQMIPRMGLNDGSFLDFDLSKTATSVDRRRANAEEAKIYAEKLFAAPRAINRLLDLGFDDEDLPESALVPLNLVPISEAETFEASEQEKSRTVDLETSTQIARYWRIKDEQKKRFEHALATKIRDVLIEEGKRVLSAFASGERDLDEVIDGMSSLYRQVFRAGYASTIEFFGEAIAEELSEKKIPRARMDLRFSFEPGSPEIISFLDETVIKDVVDVLDSTKRSIRKVVSSGLAQSKTMDDIAMLLQGQYRRWYGVDPELAFDRSRAFKISRTIVHSGAGYGQNQAAAQSRIVIGHGWITSLDGRERDSHAAIHGERKPFGQAYSNGLMYPGDPSGPAEEVIQCRCNEIFITKGEKI
jgi:HK97 family phage portal protein